MLEKFMSFEHFQREFPNATAYEYRDLCDMNELLEFVNKEIKDHREGCEGVEWDWKKPDGMPILKELMLQKAQVLQTLCAMTEVLAKYGRG